MFVVTVHFHIHPPFVESFRAAVLRQAKNSIEREPDCKQFDVSQNPENQGISFSMRCIPMQPRLQRIAKLPTLLISFQDR